MTTASSPKQSRPRGLVGLVIAGLMTGAGAAAAGYAASGARVEFVTQPKPLEIVHIEVGRMLLPLVDPNGDLVGYLAVEAKLEVAASDEATAKERLPLLQHEINMQSWHAGISAGPDHMLLDTKGVERLYVGASNAAFGDRIVRRVLLTNVSPA